LGLDQQLRASAGVTGTLFTNKARTRKLLLLLLKHPLGVILHLLPTQHCTVALLVQTRSRQLPWSPAGALQPLLGCRQGPSLPPASGGCQLQALRLQLLSTTAAAAAAAACVVHQRTHLGQLLPSGPRWLFVCWLQVSWVRRPGGTAPPGAAEGHMLPCAAAQALLLLLLTQLSCPLLVGCPISGVC
jgi:hypothetical protein